MENLSRNKRIIEQSENICKVAAVDGDKVIMECVM